MPYQREFLVVAFACLFFAGSSFAGLEHVLGTRQSRSTPPPSVPLKYSLDGQITVSLKQYSDAKRETFQFTRHSTETSELSVDLDASMRYAVEGSDQYSVYGPNTKSMCWEAVGSHTCQCKSSVDGQTMDLINRVFADPFLMMRFCHLKADMQARMHLTCSQQPSSFPDETVWRVEQYFESPIQTVADYTFDARTAKPRKVNIVFVGEHATPEDPTVVYDATIASIKQGEEVSEDVLALPAECNVGHPRMRGLAWRELAVRFLQKYLPL